MRKLPFVGASLIVIGVTSAASGADGGMLLSVAKPSAQPAATTGQKPRPGGRAPAVQQPGRLGKDQQSAAPSRPKAGGHSAAKSTVGKAGRFAAAAQGSSKTKKEPASENDQAEVGLPPVGTGELLSQAYDNYRNNPSTGQQAELLRLFKLLLAQSGARTPATTLIKSTPVLSDMGWRAIDASGGRVWTSSRLPDVHEVVVQWADSKPTVHLIGRRHRIRKVTYAITRHVDSFVLPADITVQEARILGSAEGSHILVLVGAENGSTLWLRTYRQADNNWVETASRMDSIPSFLTNNVSGKVTFRGPDLIFNIGSIVSEKVDASTNRLPAAESNTYKFWLHLTDQGYVLMPQLVDEAQFTTVQDFLEAIAASRTDVAKSLLSDGRLLSIPKYVGLRGPCPTCRVVQMASPPSGAPRYRLVTGGKDDLIFEVIRLKDKQLIRAIFIAPAEKFLQEVAAHLPTYEMLVPAKAATDRVSTDKHQ